MFSHMTIIASDISCVFYRGTKWVFKKKKKCKNKH